MPESEKASSAPEGEARVCVGVVVGAHGLRGSVRIRSFTDDPANVGAYGLLEDETGQRHFTARVTGFGKGEIVLADLTGIADRSDAESLRGTRLFVPRAALPEPAEDTFYWADLIGLPVFLPDGTLAGSVMAVHDFGAGPLLDVTTGERQSVMVPFTHAAVPTVDLAGRRVVVVREMLDSEDGERAP